MSDMRISEDFVLRVARLANEAEDMRKAASDALKDVWGDARDELKTLGLSGSEVSREVAYLKAAIAETRLTEQDRDKADAKAEGVEGYVAILNSPRARARARGGNEYAAAKGAANVDTNSAARNSANTEQGDVDGSAVRADRAGQACQNALAGQVEPRTCDVAIDVNASLAAREGEKTLHSNSPETAHSGIAQGRGEGRTLPVQVSSPAPATNSPSAVHPTAENTGAVVSSPAAAPVSNSHSSEPTSSEAEANTAGEVTPPASPAPHSDADVPAFIRAPVNERCLSQGSCKYARHPHKITCSDCGSAFIKKRAEARA